MSLSSESETSSSPTATSTLSAGQKISRRFDETTRTVLSAIVIALVIRMFAFEPFNIPSGSMIPGLLVGDFLFVSKFSYGYSSLSSLYGLLPVKGRLFESAPQRGDVVVFKLPRDNSTDYIKRLVGLPGDTVQMRHGLLYINGVAVDRERLAEPVARHYLEPSAVVVDYDETFPNGHKHVIREEGDDMPYDDTPVFRVPDHHYFMMGDNRDNSLDSRTTNVGFVPEDNLVGRASVIFFSIDESTKFWQWPFAIRWGRLFKKIV
jgi:signal peptidase I